MKKIIFIMILSINSVVYAQTESKMSHDVKNKVYQEHKKQLIEQAKAYQEIKKQKGITTDTVNKTNNEEEEVDFSTGKPVKKQ